MSTSSPKKAYHHGDLRGALLTAALSILEEHGDPALLSLREAARRAGVSAMAPYRHFADKDALLAAIATIGFEKLGASLRAAEIQAAEAQAPEVRASEVRASEVLGADAHGAAGQARRAPLDAQGVAYVAFACKHPALFRLMFGASAPAKTGGLADTATRTFGVLADRVAQMVPPGVSADVALAAWALVHGLAMLAVDGQLAHFGEPPEVLAARIVELTFGSPMSQNAMVEPSQAKKPPLSAEVKSSTTLKR